MSLASYIGCKVEVPLSDEDSNDIIIIGDCFSDESHRIAVREHQLTTPYVYEVSTDWGINISEYTNERVRNESKQKLIRLCEIMDEFLVKGDYFELYSCWVGEEDEEREGELTLKLKNFDIDKISIPEKTLVRFEK
ncbi:hypothetical protein [Cytobacillus gottheilii]|uniref:hypothetical protein n=1 Tax=Cytobacillus gottheilii TaxID=859144 RepID=UPI00249528B9|nr:hypothetical protein [Cytobacillus gottheilii]